MLKVLFSPKWIVLTLIVILVVPSFKSLSDWQYRRLYTRQTHNAAVINAQKLPTVAVDELVTGGAIKSQTDEWRTVTADGVFLDSETYLLRKRSLNSEAGFWVVTPLQLTTGEKITVVRGWTPAAKNAKANPELSKLPTQQISITGRLRTLDAHPKSEPSDLPEHQRTWLNPNYGTAYIEFMSSSPDLGTNEITLLPAPELSEGNHHSYAIQWLLFAAMLIIGYVILLRQDLINRSKLPRM